jgi:hypothetical protein
MNATAQPDPARLALQIFRATERLQETLLDMYLLDFNTIEDMEESAIDRSEELPF